MCVYEAFELDVILQHICAINSRLIRKNYLSNNCSYVMANRSDFLKYSRRRIAGEGVNSTSEIRISSKHSRL